MKRSYKILAGFLIASYWVACAPTKFSKDTEANKCQNFAQVCLTSSGRDYFDYEVKANGGLVDILFVDDNSGSMSFEQAHMAEKFNSFLSQLDSRSIDYRIGIITTDVSSAATTSTKDDSSSSSLYNPPRAINQSGAWMDGNLVKFADGSPFLSASTANKEQLFAQNIQRPETRQCENFLKQYPSSQPPSDGVRSNCPSGDERGIFAANLFFDKNPSSFVRPNAHLAIVFLADEDVRSGLYYNPANVDYQLEPYDEPSTLVNKVRGAYAGKSLSVHSIIVRPGDASCLTAQSIQMGPSSLSIYGGPTYGVTYNQILGSEGYKYAEASQMTGGVIGDICANDYGSQLANIGSNIVDRVADVTLACQSPSDLDLTLVPAQPSISWTVNGTNLHFSQAVSPGTQIKLKYSCPTL